MSEEGRKLYSHKPKKAQLKQSQGQHLKGKDFASSYSMGSSQNVTPPPPPPPPPAVKESFARRYKFLWPIVLTVNLAVGVYVFMRTNKKEGNPADEENVSLQTPTAAVTTAPVSVKTQPEPPIVESVKLRDPIAEDRQRELYKWMLEEKRKVKPQNPDEKKRIDEEKAVLKQFLRAKSVPTL